MKKIISSIVKPSGKGNIIPIIGALLTLCSMGAPFIYRGEGNQSYSTAFEYVYSFYATGAGLWYIALGIIFAAIISVFIIALPSRKMSMTAIASLAVLAISVIAAPMSLSSIHTCAYLISAGLILQGSGIFSK